MIGNPTWEDDDDEGVSPLPTRKVEIENKYFEKLKVRLGKRPDNPPEPATGAEENRSENQPAGPVIYNDDGTVYKRPP
jgi:hypothetical protein